MKRVWLITNSNSGSATAARIDAVAGHLAGAGAELAGRTFFPDDALPDHAALDAGKVDTVVLFAGDGTINAACTALSAWRGSILILPGGTMNMLAKELHGDATPEAIIDAVAADPDRQPIALPIISAEQHVGYVGLIVGPAASWVHAREYARAGRWRRLALAVRLAWRRTFDRRVRITGVAALVDPAQAIFVRAEPDALVLRAVNAAEWSAIARLGWGWLTGDWVKADPVTEARATRFGVAGRKPVLALFDGEPVLLDPGTEVSVAMSPAQFIATREHAG